MIQKLNRVSKCLTFATLFLLHWTAHSQASQYEFKNFKLNPEKLEVVRPVSPGSGVNSPQSPKGKAVLREPFDQTLQEKSSLQEDLGLDSLESPLMSEIRSFLERDFTVIRDEQRQLLFERGERYNLGVQNFNGLSWQKPMGQYTIYADRQVVPDPESDQWIASDQLVIAVNAKTFLGQLSDQGVIEISQTQLAAFAGLQFHRVYEYKYFVPSYEEGMQQNYEKLLLVFMNFVSPRVDLMQANEIIKKTDLMGFYAGAMAKVPLKYGFSLSAGVLVKAEKMSYVEIRSLSQEDIERTGQFLKVSLKESDSKSLGAELGLKLDFFNILKLTLLSFEYHVEKTKSHTTQLAFQTTDINLFIKPSPVSKALAGLMQFKGYNAILDDYRVNQQKEEEKTKVKNSRFIASGTATEEISSKISVFIPGEKDRSVIEHEGSQIKYTKGWKGALFDMALQSTMAFDIFNDFKYSRKKKAVLDYEREADEANYSAYLRQEIFLYKTHKKKTYQKRALDFIKKFTYFGEAIYSHVKSGKVRGPMKIKTKLKIKPEALLRVDGLSRGEARSLFKRMCKGQTRKEARRQDRCYRGIYRAYREFKKKGKNLESKLWHIKELVTKINYEVPHIRSLEAFFGPGGVYITGSLEGQTDTKDKFKTYFEKGVPFRNRSALDEILFSDLDIGPSLP